MSFVSSVPFGGYPRPPHSFLPKRCGANWFRMICDEMGWGILVGSGVVGSRIVYNRAPGPLGHWARGSCVWWGR